MCIWCVSKIEQMKSELGDAAGAASRRTQVVCFLLGMALGPVLFAGLVAILEM